MGAVFGIINKEGKEDMLINGRQIAAEFVEEIKAEAASLDRMPAIKCIMVGNDGGSESYLKMMGRTFEKAGFGIEIVRFEETVTTEKLVEIIEGYNKDKEVDGIMVQKPLPKHVDDEAVLGQIDPYKDLDGFHPVNAGRLFQGEDGIRPCTPQAAMLILERSGVDLNGKNVVVIGRSNIVGKPLAMLLLEKNATVTICHSRTKDLASHTKAADVVLVAVGRPKFLKKEHVTENTVVIDIGTNYVGGKMIGDADFEQLENYVAKITPVPGGVGPVTNGFLLKNALQSYKHFTNK